MSIITYHLWSLKNSKFLTLWEKSLVCCFILGLNWLLSVCVLVAVAFVTSLSVTLWLNGVCVCVICRNFEHSVLAWWTQRSVCFLQSHHHSGKISTQVRLRVCRCMKEYVFNVCSQGPILTFFHTCKWWVNCHECFLLAMEMYILQYCYFKKDVSCLLCLLCLWQPIEPIAGKVWNLAESNAYQNLYVNFEFCKKSTFVQFSPKSSDNAGWKLSKAFWYDKLFL